MHTTRRLVGPLRILLALAFAALLLAQVVVLPPLWDEMAQQSPDPAFWRWGTLVVAILGLVCVQVVIVCTWQLLTLVRDDRIFSDVSLVWVDTIVGAIGAAELLLLGAFVWSALTWEHPGLPVALLVVLVAGAALGLLVVVMRALLRQATALRTDMDAVI